MGSPATFHQDIHHSFHGSAAQFQFSLTARISLIEPREKSPFETTLGWQLTSGPTQNVPWQAHILSRPVPWQRALLRPRPAQRRRTVETKLALEPH